MARNTSMLKRGFSWDPTNSQLDLFVNGTEVANFSTTTVNFPNTAAVWNYGTSSAPLAYTAGTPAFTLYATNAGTSGSTSAEPFYVKSTLTGAGQVGGRSRFHCYTNVASGGWVNALKSYMEFGSSGSNSGLASSFCAEMLMKNASTGTGGVYAPLEIEYVAGGSSLVTQGSLSGNYATFMYIAQSGDTDGDFDDNGYFMSVQGCTAGANHLLSATSQTLKVGIGTSTRYLVLSQSQDGLGLGNSTTACSYTAGTPPVALYFTNAGTSGSTSAEPFYLKSILTGAGQVGGRARFHCYSNVSSGGWVNALKAYMEFGTSGRGSGLSSAFCAEMAIPNTNITAAGGGYMPLEVELVYGGSSVVSAGALSGNHVAFATYRFSGDTDGDFDDNGFFYTIAGLTAGAGHIFTTGNTAPATVGGTLKIGVGTTAYYLILYTSEATTT